jgi:Domain of unknown function (DUF4335)
MPTAPTVIRRYTPPTCTLEIAANKSPLSQWTGKIALKDLRFKLSFDDPRVTDDDWITLRGDRDELEALSDAVNGYVQSFLVQSTSPTATMLAPTSQTTDRGIALQPQGLLSHKLELGTLATEASSPAVTLSSTQLADLATALDEYAAEATSIPKLDRSLWISQPKNWATIAAGLLVTVGLSTSILKGLDKSAPQVASNPASSNDQRLPVTSLPSPSPTPPGFGNLPLTQLPPGTLPSPVPGSTPTPSPTTIAMAPLPSPSPDVPTIGADESKTKTSPDPTKPGTKPNIVSTTELGLPTIKDIKPVPGSSAAKIKGEAAALNGAAAPEAERRAVLDKQLALEAGSPDPIKDAPAPEPPGKRRADQANAVKKYVQQNWQKPDTAIVGNIEYRLELNADGTLRTTTPLTDQATKLQEQSGIPAIGSPIAPASDDGKSSMIRVNIDGEGNVQALPE